MQIEALSIIAGLMAQTAESALVGVNKLNVPTIAIFCGAVTKYILNVTLIPIYGENVAPISTIAYHVVDVLVAVIVLYNTLKARMDAKNVIIKPLVASIIMSVVVILVQKVCVYINIDNTVSLAVTILAGMLTYFFVVLKTKVLDDSELSQIPYVNKICHLTEN